MSIDRGDTVNILLIFSFLMNVCSDFIPIIEFFVTLLYKFQIHHLNICTKVCYISEP